MHAPLENLVRLADDLVDAARSGRSVGAGAVALGIQRPGEAPMLVTAGTTLTPTPDGRAPGGGPERPEPVTPATLFDLASVTKVVTTLVAATYLDASELDLHAPITEYLGEAAVPDPRITVQQLLTHTAGLPPTLPLWRLDGTRDERLDAIGRAELTAPPGTSHAYSCVSFLLLGRVLETIGGAQLPELARERVLIPAGAATATWWPDEAARELAAATEVMEEPARGLVRGEVHDEAAWAVGGAGNAGLFASVEDALAIARVIAGTAPAPLLSPATSRLLVTDQLPGGPSTGAIWRQGLGLRVGQGLPGGRVLPDLAGHSGFTGTGLWADPATGTVAALLTNRVHPRRDLFDIAPARERFVELAFTA